MSNVIQVDFSSKPAAEPATDKAKAEAAIRERFKKVLTDARFDERTANAVAAVIAEETAKRALEIDAALPLTFSRSITLPDASPQEVANAVNDVWIAEIQAHYAQIAKLWTQHVVLSAYDALIALANPDRLRTKD